LFGSYAQWLEAHPTTATRLGGVARVRSTALHRGHDLGLLWVTSLHLLVCFGLHAPKYGCRPLGFWVFLSDLCPYPRAIALWMPLTYAATDTITARAYWPYASYWRWWAWVAGFAGGAAEPAHWRVVVRLLAGCGGSAAFCLQTAVLDALVWPASLRYNGQPSATKRHIERLSRKATGRPSRPYPTPSSGQSLFRQYFWRIRGKNMAQEETSSAPRESTRLTTPAR